MKIYKVFILVVLVFVITSSCKKEITDIGLNLIDIGNDLNTKFTDTLTITAHSVVHDSIGGSNLRTGFIGSYWDPVFGITTASKYFQLFASKKDVFPLNTQVDSLILSIPYRGNVYGDTNSTVTISVYQMLEEFEYDTNYFTNQNFLIDESNLLAEYSFVPRPNDSISVGGVTLIPQIRIPIDNSLGEYLINATENDLDSASNFVKYFNGLYITANQATNENNGAMVDFSFISSSCNLKMHYQIADDDSLYTTNYYSSIFSKNVSNYNHYGYEHASQNFKNQVLDGQTQLGDDILYLQSFSGVRIKLNFPDIKEFLMNKKIALNNAELIIPKRDTSEFVPEPGVLFLLEIGMDGSTNNLKDYFEGASYFGGFEFGDEYRFRITRHLQQFIDEDMTDYGIWLQIPGASVEFNRLIINGSNAEENPLKLKLTYTQLNNTP